MAKRFTDTDKWKRPWFRALSPVAKLVWFYVLDNCDHCGVWHADFDLMGFQLGTKITPEKFADWFSDKYQMIDGDKYFIRTFVNFQQGELSAQKNAHKPILAFLEKHSLSMEPITMGSEPILMGPGISIGKGNGKGLSKEGGLGETKLSAPAFDFEEIYKAYPRHEGDRAQASRELKEQIRNQESYDDLAKSVQHYAELCKIRQTETRFIKQWSSFIGTKRSGFPWQGYIARPKELDGVNRVTETKDERVARMVKAREERGGVA